jgi:plasmid stabilization system protein ParE
MSFSIHWTDYAVQSFKQNIEYLHQDWSIAVVNSFIDRVDEVIGLVSQNPYLYPLHRPKDGIRKCVVHPRIVLYFKIVDKQTID